MIRISLPSLLFTGRHQVKIRQRDEHDDVEEGKHHVFVIAPQDGAVGKLLADGTVPVLWGAAL